MRTLAEDVIPPLIAALSIRDSQRHPYSYFWNYKTNKGLTLSAWKKVTPWGKNQGTKRQERISTVQPFFLYQNVTNIVVR